MKKRFFAALFAAAMLCLVCVAGCDCSGGGKTKIRLSEVTHSIFYAPMYLADNLGYFEEENLDVSFTNAGGADKVMTAVASGSADIGLMGPEAVI